MRSIAVAILVIVLLVAILQPLIETSNVLKEKVTLGAAILNSCRAARSNALNDEDMRDLNAYINETMFKQYFAEAFCETLELDLISPIGAGDLVFSSPSGRWGVITVSLQLDSPSDLYFSGREVIKADISLSTPYVFRMSLLRETAGLLPSAFMITETRGFEVQIIN
ncbi:MAG: hypothetical protein FWG87_07000 [Defluviitaleaceae bacterium]|nr:hypothetical protein [Defluviitaleaceae bacterium]